MDLTGAHGVKYGDQRLISPLDWSVVGRAWDGVLLRGRMSSTTLDFFLTNVKEASSGRRDQHFWGLYGTCKAVPGHELDAYLLGRDFGNESQVSEVRGDKGNLSDRTLGGRAKGKTGAADYSAEAAWQFGRKAGMPVRAWAAALTGGWTFSGDLKPRVGAEYDYASGDTDPADDKVQTFDPLFPFGHALQGYQDVFSWKNGHAVKLSASAAPTAATTLAADYHYFRPRRQGASVQRLDGGFGPRQRGLSGNEIGHEVDLHAGPRCAERSSSGTAIRISSPPASCGRRRGKDRDWAFLQATIDF